MDIVHDVAEQYRFGRFLLEPGRRSLTAGGTAVALSARAFDLLCLLVVRRDAVLSKDDLRAAVWRGMAVDDNNLAVQISNLRRALGGSDDGAQFIKTVPGRGYQFVAPIDVDVTPPPLVPVIVRARPAGLIDIAAPIRSPARQPGRMVAAMLAGLALAAGGAVAWLHPWSAAPAPRLSIAVLPFRNLSSETAQDYLADAISDDLTTDLSHIPRSTVIARASADIFRDRTVAAGAIGRALHVRYLLEGSIRAEADQLHVNAQLIDAPSGAHLWASAFDVPRDRLGVARAGIVRSIASALDFTLTDVEAARSRHDRPDDADAVDYFLRARSVLERDNGLPAFIEAQGLLEQAIAAAPNFSDALALLGSVLVRKTAGFDNPTEAHDHARAQQVIARALALAPENPAAITAAGFLAYGDMQCERGLASFALALSLDPNDVLARNGMALCSFQLGRMQDMIDQTQQLLRIDPASPASARRENLIGMGTLLLGRPGAAIGWLDRAGAGLADAGQDEVTLGWREWRLIYLIAATQMVGRATEAASHYDAYRRTRPRRTVWRLATYETHAQTALPGQEGYLAGLHAAGMPLYASEDEDFGVAPMAVPHEGGDFDATPLAVPGATRIATAALHALLAASPRPLVLDVGRAAGAIAGSVWLPGLGAEPPGLAQAVAAARAGKDSVIVVTSDGSTGWTSYNTVLRLVAQGFRSVRWYRGGEEAWAAAGYPSEDRRVP